MAKLKIYENNDSTLGPGKSGYISVSTELLNPQTRDEFLLKYSSEGPELLNKYSEKSSGGLYVQHETVDDNGVKASEKILTSNCKIKVEEDKRKNPKKNNDKSHHTISFPDAEGFPLNLNYLQPYVNAIIELNNGVPASPGVPAVKPSPTDACKFLFGVMLLTRCR